MYATFFFFEWLLHPCFSAAATCMCQFHVHTSDTCIILLFMGFLNFFLLLLSNISTQKRYRHFGTRSLDDLGVEYESYYNPPHYASRRQLFTSKRAFIVDRLMKTGRRRVDTCNFLYFLPLSLFLFASLCFSLLFYYNPGGDSVVAAGAFRRILRLRADRLQFDCVQKN